VIDPRSHQPSRQSDNAGDYDRLFVIRVHSLLKLGYEVLRASDYAREEETAITGDLVEAIDKTLDGAAEEWMRFFSVHDDAPVNDVKRRGRQRRKGKHRNRVDIRLDSGETSPRSRFRIECKRLGRGTGVKRYLGRNGLGCFLSGEYARDDHRAGMLGYVQSADEDTWASKIEKALLKWPRDYACREESRWRHEPVIDGLKHTYRSGHARAYGGPPIEVLHSLLRFH